MKKLLTVLSLAFVFICSCIPLSASAMFDTPIFNGVVLNPPYTEGYDKHWYFVFKDTSDTYHLLEFMSSDYSAEPKIQVRSQKDGFTMWNAAPTGARQNYAWDSTLGNWVAQGSLYTGQAYSNITTGDVSLIEIIACDVDIYDSSGNLFFQPRPYYLIATTGEMMGAISTKSLWSTMVGNLGTLIPFGVGLLALVIGLKIFGKILKIFQI